jgi:bacterial/archaeal transporter family protein
VRGGFVTAQGQDPLCQPLATRERRSRLAASGAHGSRAAAGRRRYPEIMLASHDWLVWALLSAVFAAATAILAKVGLAGIDSDFATLFRTGVILAVLGALVWTTGKWQNPAAVPPRALLFLTLSGLATGASWVCYFRALKAGEASQVAPVDKLSVVLVAIFAVLFLGERPAPKDWAGIGLVGAGVLILSLRR